MYPEKIREMQEAIRGERLDGWLFCNFRHRDKLSDEILGLDPASANSRLWLYAVPDKGDAVGIVHTIERDSLGDLPGERVFYNGREELFSRLARLAGKRWACHFSDTITAISFLDAGTCSLFEQAGLIPVCAAGLLQRFKGLLGPADIEAHERSACHLYAIVDSVWAEVRRVFARGTPLYESDLQHLMLDEFKQRNLVTGHPPIVAAGVNSANAHYSPAQRGALIAPGDIIQLDLWARENSPGSIYADISWVGQYVADIPSEIEQAFENLLSAREGALQFIQEELQAGRRPTGADVDRKSREILCRYGYGDAIRHRTGHGIDTEVHGSGVNIDSFEFPDTRRLLDGSCFSLEPGIYFEQFGMRTEIDVYIADGKPVVSGGERQFALLHC
ncbi:MAG: aminopeptidase P family protein [Treponema sp.]|jgi:Xaa-Pro aminopeptidase|nr:aminopeptidase P family protein [Treponema sp.]